MFDEATGVPHPIWTMVEGMLTSSNVKFVCIGNPTSRNSEFYKCFGSPDWHKIKLSCFDSPNLIANGVNNLDELNREIDVVRSLPDDEAQVRMQSYFAPKPYLLSLKWVVSMGMPRKWGVEHPLFISKVLGEFPQDSDGTLIPLGAVEDAQLRAAYPLPGDRKVLGVDVARFGSDATVLTGMYGKQWKFRRSLIKKATGEVIGAIAEEHGRHIFDVIVVDETGIGGGVVDGLRELARNKSDVLFGVDIRGVQFGAACIDEADKEKFVNIKARMFRLLADDVKAQDGLSLPAGLDGDVYLDELPTMLYYYDSKGRMYIESKEEYKKRTGRKSPDDADSLALANFGRYDLVSVGKFLPDKFKGFGTPFAASLGSGRQW